MLADLMYSGALDELPDLKICLAHGGGFAPYQIGRLVHGHKVRAEARISSRAPRRRTCCADSISTASSSIRRPCAT